MAAIDENAARETERQLAQDYLDGAVLAREVSRHALEQALRDAKAGTLRDPAKTAMNAAITSGTLLDKRLTLQERPTSIVAAVDPRQELRAMARDFGLTIDSIATEIPDAVQPSTEPERLQAESESVKGARE
jgi:hypothetical protein